MQLRYIGVSAADGRSLDVDLIDSRSRLPRQVRERSCGRAVDHAPVEGEFGPVARANEMPFSVVECVGATKVRAGDRECAQLPVLASQVARESWIARRVVLPSVGHDESRTG